MRQGTNWLGMRRYLYFFTCFLAVAPDLAAPTFDETVESLKRSVFPIVYYQIELKKGEGSYGAVEGTGFFVNETGHFITALHVAQAAIQNSTSSKMAVVVIPHKEWPRGSTNFIHFRSPFEIVLKDEKNDLALCKTLVNPFKDENTKYFVRPIELQELIPPDGTPVGFTAFASRMMVPISGQGIVGGYYPKVRGRHTQIEAPAIIIHGAVWTGASGGPVYLQNGRVIGVVVGSNIAEVPVLTAVRPAKFVSRLLLRAKD